MLVIECDFLFFFLNKQALKRPPIDCYIMWIMSDETFDAISIQNSGEGGV